MDDGRWVTTKNGRQVSLPPVRPSPGARYSYRSASMVLSVAARRAGHNPNTRPTAAENANATPTAVGLTSVFQPNFADMSFEAPKPSPTPSNPPAMQST